ncbi:MAG: 6,7-dimethyl-8-ribityllumazine synthase [Candidatus Omnitrophica bacterium]|nr:6,7-dimethyl-8-ribityllumazine synthase [Candidatus Omnitrophota bacterium]MDD5671992.1 6,7-dimethyl-8-ribityllumazine synthase [Candidatus Omnitrophota bacterium]
MPTHLGQLSAKGKRFGIVVSRFNEFITRRLLLSAVETLKQAGGDEAALDIVWVPGALEIPYFCQKLSRKKYDAIIALGCVLRGDTYHFECVSNEVTRGISQVALETGVPIASGIITADTLEQAIDRTGLKAGNKGAHAALAALEISDLSQNFESPQRRKS